MKIKKKAKEIPNRKSGKEPFVQFPLHDKTMSVVDHLNQLRSRLVMILISIFIGFCLVYGFVKQILEFMVKPIGKFVFISPQEAFYANIKLAFLGGLFLASPFILYQIWKFISVGLLEKEQKYVLVFCPLSFLLFVMGAVFGYFVIIPIGVKFLLGFATDFMTPMISVSNYISFVGLLTFSFSVIFELPLVMLFLTKLGLVTPQSFSSKRKNAIVIIFIAAASLTPPDVITQCLMAVPLLALFEIGILFSRIAYRKKREKEKLSEL